MNLKLCVGWMKLTRWSCDIKGPFLVAGHVKRKNIGQNENCVAEHEFVVIVLCGSDTELIILMKISSHGSFLIITRAFAKVSDFCCCCYNLHFIFLLSFFVELKLHTPSSFPNLCPAFAASSLCLKKKPSYKSIYKCEI